MKRSNLAQAALLALSGAAGAATADIDSMGLAATTDAYPVVITPSRLRQSLQDVPASVTIISSETIRKFGITTVPDALRLVPGMAIIQPSGTDFRINYHGTNVLSPRRMNVLIDGVSVYQPLYARVDWATLPVAVEDVDRIEVTRGPNSAAYGPNSMMAIINIITKHPRDVEGAMVSATRGTRGLADGTARFAAVFGQTAVRLTANKQRDEGYDRISRIGGAHDSLDVNRLNLRSQTRLSDSTIVDLDVAYLAGTRQVPFVEQYQVTNPDQRVHNGYTAVTLRSNLTPTHEVQLRSSYWSNSIRQSWASCTPTAFLLPEMFELYRSNPGLATSILRGQVPSGGSSADMALATAALQAIARLGPSGSTASTCGRANQDLAERRLDVELQDTFVFSDAFRVVSGIGARRHAGSSETFFGGTQSNSLRRVFGNAEYKPNRQITLNAGAYYERDELSDPIVSPRLAANWKFSPAQALRFVWSAGSRMPDLHEQRTDWSYTVRDISPPINGQDNTRFVQSARVNGGLVSERIRSKEIGYLLHVPSAGLMLDVRLFDEHLTRLISEKLQVSDFSPTNSNSARLRGAEIQMNVELSTNWTGFAQYGHLANEASTPTEKSQYSRHSGAAGLSHAFGDGWSWSLAYYGSSGNGPGQTPFGRTDLLLAKSLYLGPSKATVSFGAQRLDRKDATYFRDINSTTESGYDDRVRVFGRFQVSF